MPSPRGKQQNNLPRSTLHYPPFLPRDAAHPLPPPQPAPFPPILLLWWWHKLDPPLGGIPLTNPPLPPNPRHLLPHLLNRPYTTLKPWRQV
ncbi:hypothetical protein BU16DRAFT_527115 [Lophium mytilinum]|uniref:Uncharacterized protein n=1 Tax=Lophium mytilinum TaxID=390894 RepID=A0A6A6QRU6_9PEZI|nr:hypothetical protein BU16DRAFT_527115 [Lophium mytilinum]